MSRIVKLGGASGYWGESDMAWGQLLAAEKTGQKLDYIVFDYLAEITMSIMAKMRKSDPSRGYAPDFVPELQEALASRYNVNRNNVLLASGSTWLLQGAVRAYCNADKPLVTAGPTFSTSEGTARQIGAPIKQIPLDKDARLDLDSMVAASRGAGLVYFCNPNNPSGTVHGPQAIDKAVRAILAASPDTHIHLDEAYIDYVTHMTENNT